MFCSHCGSELAPDAKVCSKCGNQISNCSHSTTNSKMSPTTHNHNASTESQSQSNTVTSASGIVNSKPMKKKTGLIVLVGIAVLIGAGLITSNILKSNHYNEGVELYNDGNYEDDLTIFSSLDEYKDTAAYIKDCTYQMGVSAFKNKKYESSLSIFGDLGDYKDSQEYVHKSKLGMKYALFDSGESTNDYSLTDSDETEKYLKEYFYSTWYDSITGEPLDFDEFNFAGNLYGVKSAVLIDYYLSATCYYLGEPDTEFYVGNESEYFEYIDQSVNRLTVGFADDYDVYYNITLDEYNSLVALEEEEMAKIPNYDNQTIIDKTLSTFRAKVGSNYSGPDTLYHGVDCSDTNVSYDSSQKIYTCTMTAEYTTNVFDFWGTSTQTYFVTAEYQDTGDNLVLINFSLH